MDEKLIGQRDEVVERMRRELRALVRERGWTQRRVEQANGFTQGYLSQVFQGQITLTARHLLGVLLAIGVSPAELFARVMGGGGASDELRERMDRYEAVIERLERRGLLPPEAPGEE